MKKGVEKGYHGLISIVCDNFGRYDVELKLKLRDTIGIIRRKEICHAKAEGFKFRIVMLLLFSSYAMFSLKSKNSEVTTSQLS